MENSLTGLLEDIDCLNRRFLEKGYKGYFMTNSGHAARTPKDSVMNCIYAMCFGRERTMQEGFSMSTYLKWEGEDKPRVLAEFSMNYRFTKGFQIKEMLILHQDAYGQTQKSIRMENTSVDKIPDCAIAIRSVSPEEEKKVKRGLNY